MAGDDVVLFAPSVGVTKKFLYAINGKELPVPEAPAKEHFKGGMRPQLDIFGLPFHLRPEQQAPPSSLPPPRPSLQEEENKRLPAEEERLLKNAQEAFAKAEDSLSRVQSDLRDSRHALLEKAGHVVERKDLRITSVMELGCKKERDACVGCYTEHKEEPLKCASFVKAYSRCADAVSKEIMSRGIPAKS